MPALAGSAKMRYPTFIAFNAAGGIAWGTATVLAGYLAGESYARVEKFLGRAAALVVAGVLLIALIVWRTRRRHQEARSDVDVSDVDVSQE
jgi:membrane-associated protein